MELRRGADRFVTDAGWVRSRHAFSYGAHYDPANTRFGALIACNDDVLQSGGGFGEHPHRDVDIVTWIVEGALTHADSRGHETTLHPGMAQRLWAADGVRHSERNLTDAPARYVQMWIEPAAASSEPAAYASRDFGPALDGGDLVVVAAGPGPSVGPVPRAPLPLVRSGAVLLAARPRAGATLDLPPSPLIYLYVVRGRIALGGNALDEGDAAGISEAVSPLAVLAESASEILLWQLPADG